MMLRELINLDLYVEVYKAREGEMEVIDLYKI